MTAQIKLQSTNYSVSNTNGTLKIDGTLYKVDNRIDNYNVSIYNAEDTYIGSATYSEYEDGNVNYCYTIPAEYKADISALVNTSIADAKIEINK